MTYHPHEDLINRGWDGNGSHDAWHTPCNGFSLNDHGFDFTKDPLRHRGRHRYSFRSFVMMTEGKLDRRCFGCGQWESEWNWEHPVPPLCVFSISDFIAPEMML